MHNGEVGATGGEASRQAGCAPRGRGQGAGGPALSVEDAVGLTVVAAFLAAAAGAAALGYTAPFFWTVLPTLASALVGLAVKRLCERPGVAAFLRRLALFAAAAPSQKL